MSKLKVNSKFMNANKSNGAVVLTAITPANLRQAADQLEQLEQQIAAQRTAVVEALAGKGISVAASVKAESRPTRGRNVKTSSGKTRYFSPEAIQRIREAQKRRHRKAGHHVARQPRTAVATAPVAPAPAPAAATVAPAPAPAAPAPAPAPAPVAAAA
jgi:hypothetical protein